jgi:predicted ATPase/DNA-binding XRE family transcriptional regulator
MHEPAAPASFGYWVRRRRLALDLTQAALADLAGCAPITIHKIERDERRPSRQMAERLALYLAIGEHERSRFIASALGERAVDPLALEAGAPPLALPHNLPSLPALIGRRAELEALVDLLMRPETRLVTLLGPGGIGKTRLALAVAGYLLTLPSSATRFAGGIFFVDLTAIGTAPQLFPAIAAALKLRLEPTPGIESPRQALQSYVQSKRLLLVLDNVEHLVEAAPLLAELLRAAPGVKLLVTSRERLHLQEDHLFPVEGLPAPAAAPTVDNLAIIARSDAVALFVQAAQRSRRGFRLNSGNLAAIVAICRMVGGMPLALQLAAAWTVLLSPSQIAAEIGGSLDFLTTTLRDLPERQRSLRAVIEPSWRRLDPHDQALFAQLCLFRGSFTLAAGRAVTGCDLRALARLHDSSFLHHTAAAGRYQIHEVLRHFGATQLRVLPGVEEAAQARFAGYYCRLLDKIGTHLKGRSQLAALRLAEMEDDNLRMAWVWAAQQGRHDLQAQALDGLLRFYEWQARFAEGAHACRLALDSLGDPAEGHTALLRAHLLAWAGICARHLGEPEQAARFLAESLALCEAPSAVGSDVHVLRAFVRLRMGRFAERSDLAQAQAHYTESLTLYRALDEGRGAALALEGLGFVALENKAWQAATDYYEESLRLLEAAGDARARVRVLTRLAVALGLRRKHERAEQVAQEAEAAALLLGDRAMLAYVLGERAVISSFQAHDTAQATSAYATRSLALYQELGDSHGLPNLHMIAAQGLIDLGRYADAREHAQRVVMLARRSGDHYYRGAALMHLGQVALVEQNYGLAQQLLHESVEALQLSRQKRYLDWAYSLLGIAALRLHDDSQAHQRLVEALHLLEESEEVEAGHAFALEGVALFFAGRGAPARAAALQNLIDQELGTNGCILADDIAANELRALAAGLPPHLCVAAQQNLPSRDLRRVAHDLLVELTPMPSNSSPYTATRFPASSGSGSSPAPHTRT